MTTRAADLPPWSVVASGVLVGIKHDTDPRHGGPWRMSHGGRYRDEHIDDLQADGAEVLRVGAPEPAGEVRS